ncbi:putative leucine-rich repeat receptor-like serine/threonine-protein kinase [Hibiscus syriacus]|uniref:RING-type E3 ubiquitin transferase n=1 Tax=Hibiscus syriacus TaxID=106335 RepID=A0A6A3D0E1_HIBSY|nr:putative leucine-rich repeat receptor-like serine/threonine-protein kinase [Hibiscus syriacus]
MGACCSCFRFREPEVVSPRRTPTSIDALWDKEDRQHCYESGSEFSYKKLEAEVNFANPSSEDEDVCPTCLEEYDPENPQIVLRCSHGYHLGCIYEWMERSANCPICDKFYCLPSSLVVGTLGNWWLAELITIDCKLR